MNVPLFLARRFLAGRRGRLLGTVSALALFGVALGAASLVVAMGLMSGYRHELAEKLAGTNAEVLVIPDEARDDAGLRAELARLPGVVAVARTGFAPALLLSASAPEGTDAVVKGLDLPAGLSTTRLFASVPDLASRMSLLGRSDGRIPVLLGAGLARRLGLAAGASVVLETASASLARGLAPPRRSALAVVAVVETGFSEVDDGWAVLPLPDFERLSPPDARRGIWELKLASPSLSEATVETARKRLPAATVLDWKQLNRDLFQALLVQQTLLFVVLALIVAVAAGTVVSSLVVLLAEKTREVGVLQALGASPRTVADTFRISGLLLGGAGLLTGTLFGLLVCAVLTGFRVVRFPREIARVYYLTWMPFRPEPLHVAGILGVGLLLVLLASVLPARRAARLIPAEALRYE